MKSFYCKQPYADDQVRAIIEGRKTLLIEPLSDKDLANIFGGGRTDYEGCEIFDNGLLSELCKYKAGERYWLKESFGSKVRAVGNTPHESVCYRADNPKEVRCYDCNGNESPVKWQPSIHMPQWDSRFTMEVTRVYVKRVHDTTNDERQKASESTGISEDVWHFNDWCWFVEFKGV